jgi:hypothetical protein
MEPIVSSVDYQSLMMEIKNTINKTDAVFKEIQKSNYPDAGSYTSELINYKIDTEVKNLTDTRKQIWDFLNKKYSENTKLRTYFFDELRKVEEHIKELETQRKELIDSVKLKNTKSSTSIEKIKQEKYNFFKMEYYAFLYKLLAFIQICIILILSLSYTNILPRFTGIFITIIALLGTVAFVAYYVYFVNIARSKFSWPRFEHNNEVADKLRCGSSSTDTAADKKRKDADKAIEDIIKRSKEDGTCPKPETKTITNTTLPSTIQSTIPNTTNPTITLNF